MSIYIYIYMETHVYMYACMHVSRNTYIYIYADRVAASFLFIGVRALTLSLLPNKTQLCNQSAYTPVYMTVHEEKYGSRIQCLFSNSGSIENRMKTGSGSLKIENRMKTAQGFGCWVERGHAVTVFLALAHVAQEPAPITDDLGRVPWQIAHVGPDLWMSFRMIGH